MSTAHNNIEQAASHFYDQYLAHTETHKTLTALLYASLLPDISFLISSDQTENASLMPLRPDLEMAVAQVLDLVGHADESELPVELRSNPYFITEVIQMLCHDAVASKFDLSNYPHLDIDVYDQVLNIMISHHLSTEGFNPNVVIDLMANDRNIEIVEENIATIREAADALFFEIEELVCNLAALTGQALNPTQFHEILMLLVSPEPDNQDAAGVVSGLLHTHPDMVKSALEESHIQRLFSDYLGWEGNELFDSTFLDGVVPGEHLLNRRQMHFQLTSEALEELLTLFYRYTRKIPTSTQMLKILDQWVKTHQYVLEIKLGINRWEIAELDSTGIRPVLDTVLRKFRSQNS